jgi:hypothetical protein
MSQRRLFRKEPIEMARGWESKSVEDQLEEAARRKREAAESRQMDFSPEAIALRQRVESLRLARSQLMQQLNRARSERQRQMLLKSLEEIQQQITAIEIAPD